jgi:hypothetical protein
MLENAKVDALLVRLQGPGNGIVFGNLDPADEVALRMDNNLFDARHVDGRVGATKVKEERVGLRVAYA